MSWPHTQPQPSMPGLHMPNTPTQGVIPSSFFDMPINFAEQHANPPFGSMSHFPSADIPTSHSSDFDALTAHIAATMPPLPAAPHYDAASTSAISAPSQLYPPTAAINMEVDDSNSAASSPFPSHASTSKTAATKPKKPAKPKVEGAEPKPKKPKKKPAASTATHAAAESSKDAAASTAPKQKKPSKKKAASKQKLNEAADDQAPSAAASPAPFATPASTSKETKPKPKKVGSSKPGAKPTGKPRSSTARSASRMSSIGRDAVTPAFSRIPSQRPQDEPNDDDEPVPNRLPPQEEPDDDDDEAEADDGVEELGNDHFSTQEAIYAAQQRNMGLLSMVMDDDQLDRHMASRRGALNKASVRKLVNHVLSQSVSQHVAMVVSGVAKIFVGEIVEKAREIQAIRGEQGPLRPNHLREAHRQYYLDRERPGHYPPGTNAGYPGVGKRRRMF